MEDFVSSQSKDVPDAIESENAQALVAKFKSELSSSAQLDENAIVSKLNNQQIRALSTIFTELKPNH